MSAANSKKVPGKPFQKGASGNPTGRPKSNLLTLLSLKLDRIDPATGVSYAQVLVDKLIEMAREGDFEAQEMIWNRLEGKVTDSLELGGKGGGPLSVQVISYAYPKVAG